MMFLSILPFVGDFAIAIFFYLFHFIYLRDGTPIARL